MIRLGLDILLEERAGELANLRVGVLANQASVTRDGHHIIDALRRMNVKITALFGPEHGILGAGGPGERVNDSHHASLDVPVYSLYGKTRTPTPASLDLIDIMIADLQDVGARFYTFASTMASVMTACGDRGIPVWVLDRPNPINGRDTEGPVLEPDYSSFVGMFPIPIRHGLTMGELARLFVARFGVKCELEVIGMRGWRRNMFWDETGLRWMKPSPNMPEPDTALYYPGTCLLEGTNVSEGRGTGHPFQVIGAPWIDSDGLCRALSAYNLPGLEVHPTSWTGNGEAYRGVGIRASDRGAYRPVLTGVAVLRALRRLHPDEFEFAVPGADGRTFLDLLAGTARIRLGILEDRSPFEIASDWDCDVAGFQSLASEVMLY